MPSFRVLMSKPCEVEVHGVDNEEAAEAAARDMFVDDERSVIYGKLEIDAILPLENQ